MVNIALTTWRFTCEFHVCGLDFLVNPLAQWPYLLRMAKAFSCAGKVICENPKVDNRYETEEEIDARQRNED
jgi:hypothetical protein